MPVSQEFLKTLLQTPLALFVVMLLGSLASALKQITDGRKNGTEMTCAEYLKHWPETLSTLIVNALAFVSLLVMDQLNFFAALGIGYISNSASDLLTQGGRSKGIASGKQSGHASLAFMVVLSAMALVACSTLRPSQAPASAEGSAPSTSTAPAAANIAARAALETSVRIAVRRAVAESPRAAQKAANIRSTVVQLQALVNADSTLQALKGVVASEIGRLPLSPLDRADAMDLLDLFAIVLESEIQNSSNLRPEDVVRVNDFLTLVLRTLP
jgi:hypothetical protein